jgi:dienelactone hydrolase
MKHIYTVCFFIFLFIFIACSSVTEKTSDMRQSHKSEIESPTKEIFPTGQIIEKVVCKNDTTQSYALYLPKSYDIKKEYPVMYAFDAHGTGKLPVSFYKDLAEKYNYIIAGSNNSQNGLEWEQSKAIAATFFNDTKNRLAINYNRIYLMGFSGGARIANGLTLSDNSISGVICCGAALPAANPPVERNNYSFFGIAGNADLNYIEMKKYNMLDLIGHNVKHAFITFDGKHEWPQSPVMDEAFLWLELNNMKKDPGSRNNLLIDSLLKTETKKLEALLKQNKEYEAYQLSTKVINYYESLKDLKLFFDTYNKFKTSPVIDKELKEEEAELIKEEKLQQEYINNLQTQSFDWWKKDIASINQQIKSGKNNKESLVKKRLLSYLSLVCYMQTSGALKQNNIPAAEYFGNLYELVDPTNNEAYYLIAEIGAKQGRNVEAIKALEEAVKNDFKDKKRLEGDDAFVELKDDERFIKILEKMK